MKNKKILAVMLAMAMLLLCACSNSSNGTANNGGAANSGNDAQVEEPANNGGETAEDAGDAGETETSTPAAPAEFDGTLHGPYIMTTCGQSTGSVMLHMIATQNGLTSTDDHSLSVDTFEPGDAQTLIITTGTSGKGMGAAGTDIDVEIERCSAVAEAAKEAGLTVVIAHVEGMSRRTDANDQASIDSMLPFADVIMVVEESDSDGLFTDYATENNIPIIKTADTLSLGEYFA